MHLERCLRLLPHHNDGGGFFVAVFEKLAEHAAEAGVPPTDEPNPNPNPNPSPKPNPSPSPNPSPNPNRRHLLAHASLPVHAALLHCAPAALPPSARPSS